MAGSPISDRASAPACPSTIRGSMPSRPDRRPSTAGTTSWPRTCGICPGSTAPMRWSATLLGGWQWTGIYSFTSGDPLTILAGTDQSQTGNNLDRADYIGPSDQFGKLAPSSQRGGCTGVKHCCAVAQPNPFRKTDSRKLWKRRQRHLAWPESLDCGHGPDQELLSCAVPRRIQLPVPGASSSTCLTTHNGPIRT